MDDPNSTCGRSAPLDDPNSPKTLPSLLLKTEGPNKEELLVALGEGSEPKSGMIGDANVDTESGLVVNKG